MILQSTLALYQNSLKKINHFDGIGSLLLRLYLAPILIQAGWTKWSAFDDTAAWFGNEDWGLGLPLPYLMLSLVILAELVGGFMLLLGLLTRLTTIPLMFTMIVAATTVHWEHGWLVIADASSWLANGTLIYNESVMAAPEKVEAARSLLKEHGNYKWLTSSGKFVVLNNGIEFAATYFVMLLALLFLGGGRYLSVDYWLARRYLR